MNRAFREENIIEHETMIELMGKLDEFITNMEAHMEKHPNYEYQITMLGGEPGSYKAEVIITKYETTELTQGDAPSHGVL